MTRGLKESTTGGATEKRPTRFSRRAEQERSSALTASVVITLATLPEVTAWGDHGLVDLSLSLSLCSSLSPRRVRAPVVFGRRWCKVEPAWGRVASMAPAANGRAARQTLISCRFRGPFCLYLSTSESGFGPLPASSLSVAASPTLSFLSPYLFALPEDDAADNPIHLFILDEKPFDEPRNKRK